MNPSGCLYLKPVSHRLLHQRDIVHIGSPRREAGRGLYERGAGALAQLAGLHLLLIREQAGLDDYLHDRRLRSLYDRADVLLNIKVVALLQGADIDDHIDLGRAVLDRAACLLRLGCSGHRPQREPDNTAGLHAGSFQLAGDKLCVAAVYAYRRKSILSRLGADSFDVCLCGGCF